MKARRRTPITLSVAAVLLCLVLVSAHFTSGMYARYVTRSNGADTGHIAAFQVTAEATKTGPVKIVSGVTEDGKSTYEVKILNPSETAVRYEAQVLFTSDEDKNLFTDADSMTFSGELAPGGEATETLTLNMSDSFATDAMDLSFSNDVIPGDAGSVPFTVLVTFTQID